MKKLISSILILAMVLCCFVSCNSNDIEGVSNSSKQVVQVKFDGKAKSMSVGTVYPEAGTLYWAYTAVKQNGGGAQGQVTAPAALTEAKPGFDQTLTFSVGTWNFKLYGFNTEGERAAAISAGGDLTVKCTYYAEKTQTLTFSRTITSISLNAAPFSTTGYLKGKIKLTATTGEGNTNFVAYKIGSDSTWYTTSNAAQLIPSGPNTITLRLCEKGKNPSTEYLNESVLSNVTIYSGLTTTIGGTWDDPTTAAKFEITTGSSDTYYVVTFDPNYDNAPVIYQQVKSGSKTTAPSVSRSGWAVSKWTENADGSGEAFNSSNPVNANKTYYAQWGRTRGFGAVSDTAGRPGNVCEWVQLWENGPKFATFNVGATIDNYANVTGDISTNDGKKALDVVANTGGLYGWGGTTELKALNYENTGDNIVTSNDYYQIESSYKDKNIDADHDTAKSCWGDKWRMPKKSDFEQLMNNCSFSYYSGEDSKGKYGNLPGTIIKGKGDYSGNEVFFPYSNRIERAYQYAPLTVGSYWTITYGGPDDFSCNKLGHSGAIQPYHFLVYNGNEKLIYSGNNSSYFGCSIRAIYVGD